MIQRTATTIRYIVRYTPTLNNISYGVPDSRGTTKEGPASHHKSVLSSLVCGIYIDHILLGIKLEPSTSDFDISLKILVDGQEAHRLPAIQRGTSLSWDCVPYWFVISHPENKRGSHSRCLTCSAVNPNSRVEIRVYEKHFMRDKRVGTSTYTVSDVANLPEANLGEAASAYQV